MNWPNLLRKNSRPIDRELASIFEPDFTCYASRGLKCACSDCGRAERNQRVPSSTRARSGNATIAIGRANAQNAIDCMTKIVSKANVFIEYFNSLLVASDSIYTADI